MDILIYILIGLVAGAASGLIGIGGGIILVPALVLILGMTQHQSQGTTLALMVPPIGLWAAWEYYKKGYVDLKIAAFVCVGFIIGSFFGAKLALTLSKGTLTKIFAAVLVATGVRMFFVK